MNKYYCFLVAMAAVLACAEKNDSDSQSPDPVKEAVTPKFTVSVEGSDLTDFKWKETDSVAVYSFKGERVELAASDIDGSKATFSGITLADNEDYIPGGAIAVFPSSRLVAAGTVVLPAVYDSSEDATFVAEVSDSSLVFKYIGGVVKVTVTDLPMIAGSMVFTTPGASTGAFNVSFADGVPSLTPGAGAGNDITVNNTSSCGATDFYVNIPVPGEQEIRVAVNSEYGELYSGKAAVTVVRNSLSYMEDITINPSVYLVSDFTDWNYENACLMVGDGSTKTADLTVFRNECYGYCVVFTKADNSALAVAYGPSSNDSNSLDEVFSANNNKARTADSSSYSFSFDYLTCRSLVTSTGEWPQIYLTGTFQDTPWSLNNDTPLIMCSQVIGYGVVNASEPGTELKAYVNQYWGDTFGDSGNAKTVLNTAGKHLIVASGEINVFTGKRVLSFELAGVEGPLCITGDFNEWGTPVEMTRVGNEPLWYIDVEWPAETYFNFVLNGETMASCKPMWSNTGVTQRDGKNMSYWEGKFRIIAGGNCDNEGWAIFKRP